MSATQRAEKAANADEARELHDQFAGELANPQIPAERADDLSDAIFTLEGKFPELEEPDWQGSKVKHRGASGSTRTKDRRPKGRGRTLGERRAAGRKKAGERRQTREKSNRSRRDASRGSRQTARSRSGGRRATRRAGPRAHRAFEQTGIPSATRSATQLLMQALGLLVGGSLLYLLLTNSERPGRGGAAVEQIAHGLTKAVITFIRPTDPVQRIGQHAPPGSARARLRVGEVASRVDGGDAALSDAIDAIEDLGEYIASSPGRRRTGANYSTATAIAGAG